MPNDDIFFPTDGAGVAKGRRFCQSCPVKELCKAYALVHSLPGVWGGTSEKEREETSPVLKQLLRSLYQEHGLLENQGLLREDYQLEISHLVALPLELSDPTEDAMVG